MFTRYLARTGFADWSTPMSIAGQRSNEHQPKGEAKERPAHAAPVRLSVRSAFAFLERIIDIIKGEKRREALSTGVGGSGECIKLGAWRLAFFSLFFLLSVLAHTREVFLHVGVFFFTYLDLVPCNGVLTDVGVSWTSFSPHHLLFR